MNPVGIENALRGDTRWKVGGLRVVDDVGRQIQGYASHSSVNLGENIDFHVALANAEDFAIDIVRIGHYGGAGGRRVARSPRLRGRPRRAPAAGDAGQIRCRWPRSWRLAVPPDWTSGVYLAVFRSANGWRSATPFVVRDDSRTAALRVVLPFYTYQAYNQWPADGRAGKSLYYGYDRAGQRVWTERAAKVSFDRPYAGAGLPSRCAVDLDAVRWLERHSYDVAYLASDDLDIGRTEAGRQRGLVFCGHDEYWTAAMRGNAESLLAQGVSLAFLAANNVYWRSRVEGARRGRPARTLVCYKEAPDPRPGGTHRWRDDRASPREPEQRLLGAQFNGIVRGRWPLVVTGADHWFWAGCGVADGDHIGGVVGVEADGVASSVPVEGSRTVLAASPYRDRGGASKTQHTVVRELPNGALVFLAGSMDWPVAMARPGRRDPRIERATRNVLDRIGRTV
ncbi:hypothetical protein GCM10010201_00130 [Pilimelia columellifera subsp. columellifera]|uniref:N,N-dimethylformamidase beta subunit-like C-terminal domain-containing protein n=1 Tax=Pilimelia columellifera subsp. columellifera TaxID=706583 RepID=A0ABN3MWE7_9ACTN